MHAATDPSRNDLIPWLALHHMPGLSAPMALALTDREGSAEGALRKLRQAPPPGLESARAWLDTEAAHLSAEALAWSGKGGSLLSYADPLYPQLLRQLAHPPLVLYVMGAVSCLHQRQVAVIGSRNPSASGTHIAAQFAGALVRAGLVITAGLAMGIDGSAHRGALAAGGATVAVLGSGLRRIYPRAHIRLAEELVADGGALVSEFALDAAPRRGHFPRRNRLISGLCLGVVVVEASVRSGSLITARHALDQGRELFAVPGSVHNPLARGCHQLLRAGACLVESAADVLEELGLQTASAAAPPEVHTEEALPAPMRDFLRRVGSGPVTAEALMRHADLTAAEVSSMLIDLEIRGYVCSQNDGNYCRIR